MCVDSFLVVFFGCVEASWRFVDTLEDEVVQCNRSLIARACATQRRTVFMGMLLYEVKAIAQIIAEEIHEDDIPSCYDAHKTHLVDHESLETHVDRWRANGSQDGVVPIVLALPHCLALLTRECPILFVGCIGLRHHRGDFLGSRPTTQQLASFRAAATVQPIRDLRRFASVDDGLNLTVLDSYPFYVLLDCVRATSFLRDLKQVKEAAEAWAAVIANGGLESKETIIQRLQVAGRETIRKARVKLDLLACLLWREFFWSCVCLQECQLSLFIDASPQRLGQELFAVSYEIWHQGECHRRFMPAVQPLGKTALEKVYTILWMLFLKFGPDISRLSDACANVRAIVSDLGTERLVAYHPNCLGTFFECIGYPVEQPPSRLLDCNRLFPRAIYISGWRHMWDNILQSILRACDFFLSFITKLKAAAMHSFGDICLS